MPGFEALVTHPASVIVGREIRALAMIREVLVEGVWVVLRLASDLQYKGVTVRVQVAEALESVTEESGLGRRSVAICILLENAHEAGARRTRR